MNEAAYLELIRGEKRGLAATFGRAGLALAAIPYRAIIQSRNYAFDNGWKKIHRASVPVVSVGNLTLGGTGKTPMVEWVARWFRDHGRRGAILSRGYGESEGINDEGRVLEENLPDVPHLQGKDRAALAAIAVEELDSQVLVLDDGFQHRRLARDLDIVLLDALDPFGLNRMFPRGLLREPISSLRRASVVVLSRADLVSESERAAIRAVAEKHSNHLEWAEARHRPLEIVDSELHATPLDELKSRRVVAFCGIGNPQGYRRTLEQLGTAVAGFRPFRDHHNYNARDVSELAAWARELGADLLLTTQKDLVKLRATSLGTVPLRALRIGLEITSGEERMTRALVELLRKTA